MTAAALFSVARTGVLNADSEGTKEYAVKAAYIYNFAKFVDWPSEAFTKPDAPFIIGIVGKDPFEGGLERAVQGKAIGGHSFVVKRLTSEPDMTTCHILFVCGSEKDKITHLLAVAKNSPVLTVGESPRFANRGGVVNFVVEQGSVRFEINPEAAKRAHLTISSKLLGLAKIAKDEGN